MQIKTFQFNLYLNQYLHHDESKRPDLPGRVPVFRIELNRNSLWWRFYHFKTSQPIIFKNATWADEAFFYHIYPLGLCGAPRRNDFGAPPVARLERLYPWLDQLQSLGATAIYLGPLFESTAHGFNSADYYHVDRRLGDRATLADFAREVQRRGLRLVLDGVFNLSGGISGGTILPGCRLRDNQFLDWEMHFLTASQSY